MELIDFISLGIIVVMIFLGVCGLLRKLVRFCLDIGLGLAAACLIVCCMIYTVGVCTPALASDMGFESSPVVQTFYHLTQVVRDWIQ